MKDIKTKSTGGRLHTFDGAGSAPKSAMKELWLHTKDKALSETMNTPFAAHRETPGNGPANTAGDQMLSGAEAAAKKVVETAYDGGQKLTRFAGQKVKERRAAARIKNQVSGMARPGAPTRQAGKRSIKVRQPACGQAQAKRGKGRQAGRERDQRGKTGSRQRPEICEDGTACCPAHAGGGQSHCAKYPGSGPSSGSRRESSNHSGTGSRRGHRRGWMGVGGGYPAYLPDRTGSRFLLWHLLRR